MCLSKYKTEIKKEVNTKKLHTKKSVLDLVYRIFDHVKENTVSLKRYKKTCCALEKKMKEVKILKKRLRDKEMCLKLGLKRIEKANGFK